MVTRVLRGGALMLLGTSGAVAALQSAPPAYVWNLPKGFPAPRVPADNTMTIAKVELGRHLFYISAAARRNALFSQPFTCFRCHNGFLMGGGADFEGRERDAEYSVEFHNTGLYNLAGALSYPPPNTGIYEITHRAEDIGKFKAPTLRNIALTGPYMHDGSIATPDGVLDHYAAGGRTIAAGPNQGVGHDNVNKSRSIRGFPLSADQRADLLAFLNSLTDEAVLHDPRFANPWPPPQETR